MTESFGQDNRTIGIVIPTFNRCDEVVQCIEKIKDDLRISEITIIDDCSEEIIYRMLEESFYYDDKVRLGRNDSHLGEELNQHRAILMSDSEWVLLLNTNTILTPELLDKFFNMKWNEVFIHREKYLKGSPHSIHLEKEETETP